MPTLLLGSGADVDRRTVAGIHRREERAFEIRQRDLFTTESGRLFYRARLGVYVCFFSSRCRCSGCRFRGVFLGSVRICLFRVGNPADNCTGNRPGLRSRSGGFSKLREEMLRRGFLPSSEGSELYLCMPKSFSAYKGTARSARPGGVPESRHLNDNHEKEDRTPDNNRPQGSQV